MSQPLRIGTRGSRLALAQAEWLRAKLERLLDGRGAELVVIKTAGDRFTDKPLRDIGGKGLFVKEIEQALLDKDIDCAVHSMKDVPSALAGDLVLAAIPEREDPRDVLISAQGVGLDGLPSGSRIGTSSTRRAALCRALRPDSHVADLRGNVDTRLRKLQEGQFDAILLAAAGLHRLGIEPEGAHPLDPQEFVPAIGQGALAVEARPDQVADLLARLDDPTTRACATAEREVLAALGGSCHTPIAAYAVVEGSSLQIHGLVASPDGGRVVRARASGDQTHARELGRRLADALLERGGREILDALESP